MRQECCDSNTGAAAKLLMERCRPPGWPCRVQISQLTASVQTASIFDSSQVFDTIRAAGTACNTSNVLISKCERWKHRWSWKHLLESLLVHVSL